MGLWKITTDIIKAIGIGIIIYSILLLAFGFYAGWYVSGYNARAYEQYAIDAQEENNDLEILLSSLDGEKARLNDQIDLLTVQKRELENNIRTLSDDNTRLRIELNTIRTEKQNLEVYKTLYNAKSASTSTPISSNTPVQTPQKTVSYSTATKYTPAMNYPQYTSRTDTPFPSIYAVITPNIEGFVQGKDFNGTVNAIRSLEYILHGNVDGDNTIIQYADETLVRGKGDCTDKSLLLYACLRAMGYGEKNLFIASMNTCDGRYDHSVVLMTNPPGDRKNWGHFSFTLNGTPYYIIDPTNWAGTPMNSGLSYYEECYTIGNIYSYGTTSIYGLDDVPMHGIKVSR